MCALWNVMLESDSWLSSMGLCGEVLAPRESGETLKKWGLSGRISVPGKGHLHEEDH